MASVTKRRLSAMAAVLGGAMMAGANRAAQADPLSVPNGDFSQPITLVNSFPPDNWESAAPISDGTVTTTSATTLGLTGLPGQTASTQVAEITSPSSISIGDVLYQQGSTTSWAAIADNTTYSMTVYVGEIAADSPDATIALVAQNPNNGSLIGLASATVLSTDNAAQGNPTGSPVQSLGAYVPVTLSYTTGAGMFDPNAGYPLIAFLTSGGPGPDSTGVFAHVTASATPVPEPASLALLATTATLGLTRRRRHPRPFDPPAAIG